MKREIQRTGLHLFQVTTLEPSDSAQDFKALLRAATPDARLARAKERAQAYRDVSQLHSEIQEVEEMLRDKKETALGRLYALTAVERALDLLDTGRYFDAVLRDAKGQQGRSSGARASNVQRAKLPSRHDLMAEIELLVQDGTRNPRDARSIIRRKYGVTAQALSQKLRASQKK